MNEFGFFYQGVEDPDFYVACQGIIHYLHVHIFSKSNLEDAFDYFITQIYIFYLKREDIFHIFLLTESTISIFLIIRELFIVLTCINRPQGEHIVGPLADDLAGEHLYSGGPDQHH